MRLWLKLASCLLESLHRFHPIMAKVMDGILKKFANEDLEKME